MNDALRESKKQLRRVLLARRDAMMPAEHAAASAAITARIGGLDLFRRARCLLAYLSFGSEFDSAGLIEAARALGHAIVLPRVDRARGGLVLHRVEGNALLREGPWGIREPLPDSPVATLDDIDLVLLPGVGFDRLGNRLGYGGGYYDRLLAAPVAGGAHARRVTRIAAAFDCQVVAAVPAAAGDQAIDVLVTESQLQVFNP